MSNKTKIIGLALVAAAALAAVVWGAEYRCVTVFDTESYVKDTNNPWTVIYPGIDGGSYMTVASALGRTPITNSVTIPVTNVAVVFGYRLAGSSSNSFRVSGAKLALANGLWHYSGGANVTFTNTATGCQLTNFVGTSYRMTNTGAGGGPYYLLVGPPTPARAWTVSGTNTLTGPTAFYYCTNLDAYATNVILSAWQSADGSNNWIATSVWKCTNTYNDAFSGRAPVSDSAFITSTNLTLDPFLGWVKFGISNAAQVAPLTQMFLRVYYRE